MEMGSPQATQGSGRKKAPWAFPLQGAPHFQGQVELLERSQVFQENLVLLRCFSLSRVGLLIIKDT